MHSSEVARLRAQIEAECQAMRHLESFTARASHEAILNQYKSIGRTRDQLAEYVGEEEAASIAFASYYQAIEGIKK